MQQAGVKTFGKSVVKMGEPLQAHGCRYGRGASGSDYESTPNGINAQLRRKRLTRAARSRTLHRLAQVDVLKGSALTLRQKRLYAKQRRQQERERAVTSAICQRYWGEAGLLETSCGSDMLIAAPQDRLFLGRQTERLANRKGLRQTMPCCGQACRLRMEYALM
jgi:hypothetical protein